MKHFVICLIVSISLLTCFQGCSGQESLPKATNNTGSATFSVQWPDNASMKLNGILPEASSITNVDCASLGVATVSATFTDSSGTTLSSGSWSCSAHTGTVDNIPEGSEYKIIVTAKNTNGTNLYRGYKTGISIITDQNTDIGIVPIDNIVEGVLSYTHESCSSNGDAITVQQVSGVSPPIVPGSSYKICGTYVLNSRDSAEICAANGGGSTNGSQEISRGSGNYCVTFTVTKVQAGYEKSIGIGFFPSGGGSEFYYCNNIYLQ
jgi:hypothetical protein